MRKTVSMQLSQDARKALRRSREGPHPLWPFSRAQSTVLPTLPAPASPTLPATVDDLAFCFLRCLVWFPVCLWLPQPQVFSLFPCVYPLASALTPNFSLHSCVPQREDLIGWGTPTPSWHRPWLNGSYTRSWILQHQWGSHSLTQV